MGGDTYKFVGGIDRTACVSNNPYKEQTIFNPLVFHQWQFSLLDSILLSSAIHRSLHLAMPKNAGMCQQQSIYRTNYLSSSGAASVTAVFLYHIKKIISQTGLPFNGFSGTQSLQASLLNSVISLLKIFPIVFLH